MRKVKTSVFLATLLALACFRAGGLSALDLSLVVPDDPVYIPTASGLYAAGRTQAEAAGRLQMLIERAGAGRPPIVPAAQAPASGRRIFVGYGPHLEGRLAPPTEPEGLKIAEREGDVFLLGEIAPPGTNNWPGAVDRGLMHAVETFAERVMGYRFLVSDPGDGELFELGTAVPDLKQLDIPAGLLIEEAPVFRHRVANFRRGTRGRIGLRSGSAPAFNVNHSYNVAGWARRYAEEHPELFIPRVDESDAGEAAQVEAMGAARHLNYLDYTEPLVLEKHLEHLQEFFETGTNPGGVFYRFPTIIHIMEEPPDMMPPSFRYNERSRALWNPEAKSLGRFSNIWFDYLSRLGREVKERWPHMRISAAAYMRHYDTPSFEIPDNIDVMVALMRTSMGNKEPYVFEKNLAHVKKWSDFLDGDRSRLFLWEYGCWPSFWLTPPLVAPFAMQRWLQAVRPYVSGVFFEHYDMPEFYLMPRLWMRLLWDPDLDVDAEIADLCGHLYGPAAESMAAFYRRLAGRFEMEWENPRLIWDQYYLVPELYYGQSYPRAETDRLAALLEEARRAAGLPAALEARARHGTAVHLYNLEAETVPVAFTLAALEHEIADPAIGWEGGRLAWRGRLQPLERLEISAPGRSELVSPDGTSRVVEIEYSGSAPEIRPGSSAVFHFWHGGADRDAAFRAALAYGPGAGAGSEDIYRRRLAWVRDAFLVYQTEKSGVYGQVERGFLAEAHVAHRFLGRPPFYEAPDLQGLPGDLDDPRWGNIPAAELVAGRNEWRGSLDTYQRMGFPADRRTLVRFAYDEREGLAVLVEAEGAPLEGERFELTVGERTVGFSPSGEPGESPAPAAFEQGERSWRALLLAGWGEIGLTPGRGVPAELGVQAVRARGEDHYLWSPPLGSPWGHGRQGAGLLRLANR